MSHCIYGRYESCKNYWACKMIYERFKVLNCEALWRQKIYFKHQKELNNRKELLEKIKNRGE